MSDIKTHSDKLGSRDPHPGVLLIESQAVHKKQVLILGDKLATHQSDQDYTQVDRVKPSATPTFSEGNIDI